jgi:hypothetical protein
MIMGYKKFLNKKRWVRKIRLKTDRGCKSKGEPIIFFLNPILSSSPHLLRPSPAFASPS